ncbi:YpmS family protein [Bacillus sp. 31A1R]|uniref:YpmS family protein n=1 Tax=Robertmurraya mangrovi TaxID=3098077 RepID=A0ABU5J175_9BACI|nr:YpmS family protein [Bacillus sp. 31A1R]MDZ5473116.1 YpmS family protein [Bacillus sp. 31A1R]
MKMYWKRLFFILLGINIAVLAVLAFLLYVPADEDLDLQDYDDEQLVKFNIQSNKKDLNKLINHYIETEGPKSPFKYNVLLTDEVELYGTIKVFTQDIEMKLTFEPEALPNGDLLLKQKSISIGQLQLPVSYVLKFIRDKYDFPRWVIIQPNDEMIYVSLQKMKLKSDIKVKVDEFNLKSDLIKFTLMVPTQR